MYKIIPSLLILILVIVSCKSSQKTTQEVIEKLGPNPYLMVDNKPMQHSEMGNVDPNSVMTLTMYYGKEAENEFGEIAKDGAIIVETKSYVTNRLNKLFSSNSTDYNELTKNVEFDQIQFVLNDEVLREKYLERLSSINEKALKSVNVIQKAQLKNEYRIEDKEMGVLLKVKKRYLK
jgi:hypothetical protein